MQVCFKCHIEKPLTEFYKHPEMLNGHVGKCKECNKKDVRDNYGVRKEQYKEYYAEREKTDRRKVWRFNAQRKQKKANPVQYHCRLITQNAIKKGLLVKQPCRICGKLKAEAHHEDYHSPLIVDWLCFKCHRELHQEREGQANESTSVQGVSNSRKTQTR
jgi:hypothetical protein